MNQTSVIGGALLLAFAIFVIVRGELPCYFQTLGVATDAACPKGDQTNVQAGVPVQAASNIIVGSNNSCSGFLGSLECGAGARIGGAIGTQIGNIGCTIFGCFGGGGIFGGGDLGGLFNPSGFGEF